MLIGSAAGDGIPIAIGAILTVAGTVIFIMRTHALNEGDLDTRNTVTGMRRVALRNLLAAYAIVGWICCIVTVIIGDAVIIVLSLLFAVLASAGWLRVSLASNEESVPK